MFKVFIFIYERLIETRKISKTEAYSEPYQIPKMELFTKIVNNVQS